MCVVRKSIAFVSGFLQTPRAARLFGLAALLIAFSDPSQAQQPTKSPRVGLLLPGSALSFTTRVAAFKRGLRDLGYVEGKNLILEPRYAAEDQPARLVALALELINLKIDILVTVSSSGINAAKKASGTIPIVFASLRPDPVEAGYVASLARPGGNITGTTILAPELDSKRLEILKETFPMFDRVGFLRRAGVGGDRALSQAEGASKALGLQLQPLVVAGEQDFDKVFDTARTSGVQGFVATPNPLFTNHAKKIVDLAAKNRLPGVYSFFEFAELGGLMSYGPDVLDNYRRAAAYVDKILKGAKPADLPVQQPTKFEFLINLKTAKQIGLTIPPNVLARADRVIR